MLLMVLACVLGSGGGLVIDGREVRQDGGDWVVSYRLKGGDPAAARLAVAVDGDVSNSAVPGHGRPLRAAHALAGLAVAGGRAEGRDDVVLIEGDGDRRCVETLEATLEPAPGGGLRLRLRLAHRHAAHDAWDPLLGERAVRIRLGDAAVFDRVALVRVRRWTRPVGLTPPPAERVAAPTRRGQQVVRGLYLHAYAPGRHYYRFADMAVPGGAVLRLHFRYLAAVGTDARPHVRVAQYRDTPSSWVALPAGQFDAELLRTGRWMTMDREIRVAAGATTLALDFRLAGEAEVGELWVDEISLRPPGCPAATGP